MNQEQKTIKIWVMIKANQKGMQELRESQKLKELCWTEF